MNALVPTLNNPLRRLLIAWRLHRDRDLRYPWRHAWNVAGRLA